MCAEQKLSWYSALGWIVKERGLMNRAIRLLTILVVLTGFVISHYGLASSQERPASDNRLAVLWISGDPEVAQKACLMYAHNAKKQKWFDEVTLIVWGPSAKLLAGNENLQAEIKAMLSDGVKIQACQACSDSYGVSNQLRSLGIDVKYMGKPLTDLLKSGWKVLTY
jgi:hypothetical protein